jgi:hypothetical protein
VLDQVLAARSVGRNGGLQLACHIELVKAGKDQFLDLRFLVAHRDDVAAENLQPAFPLPHLFPKVGRAVTALRVHRVASRTVVALVEGQEVCGRARQLGHHGRFAVADREVHQGPAGKGEQRLGGVSLGTGQAVEAILIDGVVHALGEIGLQIDGGDRNAVEEQPQVDAVFIVKGILHLPDHAQPVDRVAGENLGVDSQRGFEFGQLERLPQTEQLYPLAKHVEGAPLIELVAQAAQQGFGGPSAVVLLKGLPGLWLGDLHPREHVRWENRPCPVVVGGIALGVQPAVRPEVLANLDLEIDFPVQVGGHGIRTSCP